MSSLPLERQLPLCAQDKRCPHCCLLKPCHEFGRHRGTKDGFQIWCKACRKAYRDANRARINAALQAHYQAHRQERLARDRAAYAANPEPKRRAALAYQNAHAAQRRAYKTQWYRANRERILGGHRQRRREGREEINAQKRQRRLAQPEEARRQARLYYQGHSGIFKLHARLRQVRLRRVPGRYHLADIALIAEAQRGRCAYCQVLLGGDRHVDHMVPLSHQTSTNWPWNLCVTCARCNLRKGARSAGHFLALLRRERRALLASLSAPGAMPAPPGDAL